MLLSLPVMAEGEGEGEGDNVTVLVVRHRWHTGIAFPADRLSPALAFLEPHFSDPTFYEFGWGDDAFYRQDDSWWLRVRAMLWPTRSALHVVGLERHPAELPHTDLQALCLRGVISGWIHKASCLPVTPDCTGTAVSSPPKAPSGSATPAIPGQTNDCGMLGYRYDPFLL